MSLPEKPKREFVIIDDKPKGKPKARSRIALRRIIFAVPVILLAIGFLSVFLFRALPVPELPVPTLAILETKTVQTSAPAAVPTLSAEQIYDVTWSPNGQYVGVVGMFSARVYDTNRVTPPGTLISGYEGYGSALDFSPDSRYAALSVSVFGGYDENGSARQEPALSQVVLWDIQTQTIEARLDHHQYIDHVVFSPNGETLASMTRDMRLNLWDWQRGQEIETFETDFMNQTGWVQEIVLNDAQEALLAGSIQPEANHNSFLMDAVSLEPSDDAGSDRGSLLEFPEAGFLWDASLDRDASRVALLDNLGLSVYAVDDFDEGPLWTAPLEQWGVAYDLALSPDGQKVALAYTSTTASEDGFVLIYDLDSGSLYHRFDGVGGRLAWSPDGSRLVCGTFAGRLTIWDVTAKTVLHDVRI